MVVEKEGRRELGKREGFKSPGLLLLPSDKTPPVKTCGLKPSTLKQLGQPIQQPPSTGEVKVRPSPKRNTAWKSTWCV